jgi:serine/threonine-protein kinase
MFVRSLDQLEPARVGMFSSARAPFFSPNGDWVGYFDPDLKKVQVSGGPAVVIARAVGTPRGGAWGADGRIVFATNDISTGLLAVPEAGGEPTVLTRPNRQNGEGDHLWPELLPGGRGVVFTITAFGRGLDSAQIAVLDSKTGDYKVVVSGGSHGMYVPSGHLVYGSGGTLRAIAFDLDRLEAIGSPVPVLPDVVTTQFGAVNFAASANGTVAYMPGATAANARTVVWVDRDGREEPLGLPVRPYQQVRLSPDGSRVALDIRDQQGDIWLWEFARRSLVRLTFNPTPDRFPVWTPDGRRLVFTSERFGATNLFVVPVDGTGTEERLTESTNQHYPGSVSSDGRYVVFREVHANPGDLAMVPLDGDRTIQPLASTPSIEQNPEISPNGRWIAYESNATGTFEVYVRPFPDTASAQAQVSTSGGRQPVWGRNGDELFYLTLTGGVMGVTVTPGTQWVAGTPRVVLDRPYYHASGPVSGTGRSYDVSEDGRRFLMIKQADAERADLPPSHIVVVLNWFDELRRLVPVN